MAFCINCGEKIPDGAKFCPNCGTAQDDSGTKRKVVYEGDIHKCPNCGEVLGSFSFACPTCGYELRNVKKSDAVREFSTKYEKCSSYSQKYDLVRIFSIPNSKEDILEFMILAVSNIYVPSISDLEDIEDEIVLSEAWITKYKQCHEKAKTLLKNTDDFKDIDEDFRKRSKKIRRTKKKYEKRIRKINSEEKKGRFTSARML